MKPHKNVVITTHLLKNKIKGGGKLSEFKLYFLITWLIFPFALASAQQSDPLPLQCAGLEVPEIPEQLVMDNCTHTSSLWLSNDRYIPHPDARSIRVRANFIILQKTDGTGNFQDIPEHRDFLDEWLEVCNTRFKMLWGNSNCSPLITDVKVQIEPNWIFLPDPDPAEWNWDNDNNSGTHECPNTSTWWLNNLDAALNSDPNIPRGINVYLTTDGSVYNEMVVLGTRNNPSQQPGGMSYIWCSEWPNENNLDAPSRISIANLFLKYWWFQKHPEVVGAPFSVSRQWLVDEGGVLAHEFGHSFIDCYVHKTGCENHLMAAGAPSWSNVMLEDDAGCIHRNLTRSNLRQFIACDETYDPGHPNWTSTTYDRIVSSDELWDLDMRLYSSVTVQTGATLTISCKLLMPSEGVIKVERGARLIIDGGTIMRANTCSPSEYWRAIAVAGNHAKIQPLPDGILAVDDAGVVILRNQGLLEGARIGVTTMRIPGHHEPLYWGGVVDVNDFTFLDCRKGVEFMEYTFPNRSKFEKANFIRSSTGTSYAGVSMWATNGIIFDECSFDGMTQQGIITWDAIFNVRKKNKFSGSPIGILASGSKPLSGWITVGVLGQEGDDRNVFANNVVGIRATSNSKVRIFSNDFENSNFDVAINGTTNSIITDNSFTGSAAGNQFENTGQNYNATQCNTYSGNVVGTNILGLNYGFIFQQENFSTLLHDLYLEGLASSPGIIQPNQGNVGNARWNYFSAGKPENIKTSTVPPYNNTEAFWYYHPDPGIDARLKPKCPQNEACTPYSKFFNWLTSGGAEILCAFPEPPLPPCPTKPCLEVIRTQISQKTDEYAQNPSDALLAELQVLTTEREWVTDELIWGYLGNGDWTSVEALLNEDLNPSNRRRLVGAKLAQQQYAEANNLLQNFPQTTADDAFFVAVQTINTAWLNDTSFALSSSEEATLLAIAEAPTPEAGYAQALLGLLTDRTFMPRFPDLLDERSVETAARTKYPVSLLKVSPNPVSDLVQIDFPPSDQLCTIELRSLATGLLILKLDVHEQEFASLSVEDIPAGMYLVLLRERGAIVGQCKVVIQH